MGFLRKENMNEHNLKEKQYVRVHNYILHEKCYLSRELRRFFFFSVSIQYVIVDLL